MTIRGRFLCLLALVLASCNTACPDCNELGLRAQIDILERRQEEDEMLIGFLEMRLAICQGDVDDVLTDLDGAMRTLRTGREITQALISKLDKMETHDMEQERARDWAMGPEAPEL